MWLCCYILTVLTHFQAVNRILPRLTFGLSKRAVILFLCFVYAMIPTIFYTKYTVRELPALICGLFFDDLLFIFVLSKIVKWRQDMYICITLVGISPTVTPVISYWNSCVAARPLNKYASSETTTQISSLFQGHVHVYNLSVNKAPECRFVFRGCTPYDTSVR